MIPRNLGSSVRRLCGLSALALFVAGCATTQYETRPFFLHEKDVESHGRKTWLDHLVEVDPGKADFHVASNYQQDPPQRIAVLPFTDHGKGNFILNKIPLSLYRRKQDRQEWAWTYAQRLRRATTGELAEREFIVVPIPLIDAVLAAHGITDESKLDAVPPQEVGQWLGVDTVVYGDVLNYEAYYAFLVSAYQVDAHLKMVSTRDGHEIFWGGDDRYSVDVRPSFDMMDIAINSGLSLLELRDVTLARAEEEVVREMSRRLPVAQRNLDELKIEAKRRSEEIDIGEDNHSGAGLRNNLTAGLQ
jgi:putative lipoprotein DUF799